MFGFSNRQEKQDTLEALGYTIYTTSRLSVADLEKNGSLMNYASYATEMTNRRPRAIIVAIDKTKPVLSGSFGLPFREQEDMYKEYKRDLSKDGIKEIWTGMLYVAQIAQMGSVLKDFWVSGADKTTDGYGAIVGRYSADRRLGVNDWNRGRSNSDIGALRAVVLS